MSSSLNKDLGNYAVITGASSGIGACLARELANEGFDLVLTARRLDRLEALAAEIKDKYKKESIVIQADLSQKSECFRLIKEIEEIPYSVFINNAGFGDCGPFLKSDLDKELDMIDVNIRAVHIFTKEVLKKFEALGGGALLNVASSAGLIPAGPYMATYYATKAYVVSLTSAVAEELSEKNSPIYIGALCPGPVDTEFNDVANVKFALKSISPEECAHYAIEKMKAKKEVIVPGAELKFATSFGKLLPRKSYIKAVGKQQTKKLPQTSI